MGRHFLYAVVVLSMIVNDHLPLKAVHLTGYAQGTTWLITYYADDSIVTRSDIDSILQGIDSSLSLYKPYSLIVQFNNSSRGVKMDQHFHKVVARSIEISRATNGLSDITVGPLVDAWGFGAVKRDSLPSQDAITKIMECVGSNKIMIKGDSLVKSTPCVRIDANGIAQGYSVDVLSTFLESRGIKNYLVELGGELKVKGNKPNGEFFKVGIESPGNEEFSAAPMQKIISLKDNAITTSGNYRRFYESNGKKINHIIDPRSGQPVANEMISVTVIASDATTADAYDNALLLMSMEEAVRFADATDNLAAFIIYKKIDGTVADTTSKRFSNLFNNQTISSHNN